ncbi:MAG: 30S ribosomal protein S15 [Elusimicrobiota bacterium]
MVMTKEVKSGIVGKYRVHEKDTGSSAVQVALITERINYLTEHLKARKNDFATRRGLLKLVGQRRRLLNYLRKDDYDQYKSLVDKLGLRK